MATNTEFPAATFRYDPYKSYRFRVKWDGRYVAGVSKASALKRTPPAATHRVGGDLTVPRRSPGQSEYEAITLERGVTHDTPFVQWVNKVWAYPNSTGGASQSAGKAASLEDFRKDIVLELYNEAGQKVLAYTIYRCWVSEFQGMPELDANGDAVAIQTIKLENEGWERDTSFPEPEEPSFTLPTS